MKNPYECPHVTTNLRRLTLRNNTIQTWRQCATCGRKVENVAHAKALAECRMANLSSIPEFDVDLESQVYESWREFQNNEYLKAKAEESENWWSRYSEYLKSPEWRERANKVLSLRQYCQAFFPGCSLTATQVHHLNYSHVFNEPLFDLVAVCSSCHKKITEMDRERASR